MNAGFSCGSDPFRNARVSVSDVTFCGQVVQNCLVFRLRGPEHPGTSIAKPTLTMNNIGSQTQSVPVVELDENSRGRFVSRAYTHLFGAVTSFILIEVLLLKPGLAEPIAQGLL